MFVFSDFYVYLFFFFFFDVYASKICFLVWFFWFLRFPVCFLSFCSLTTLVRMFILSDFYVYQSVLIWFSVFVYVRKVGFFLSTFLCLFLITYNILYLCVSFFCSISMCMRFFLVWVLWFYVCLLNFPFFIQLSINFNYEKLDIWTVSFHSVHFTYAFLVRVCCTCVCIFY